MRNLKKILALVLALIMSLSLMATAGASQFPDVDDSNPYKTAIDVLDELKVFQGFDDGTFKPTDTLNRAQAAALVYRIATGDVEGKYVDNYTDMAQSKFADLDGYGWAKGYINYCQNAEIVVGTSSTTFEPGKQVTGYQLLVMLLRTLGYGKENEFADPMGWELQTAKIAEREGILKNITSGDLGAPAARQMVAEILFQGLLTPTVEHTQLNGYTKGITLGKKNLGLEKLEGIVMANEYASLTSDSTLADGKTALKTADKTYTLNVGSTLDDIGEYRFTYVIPASGSRNSDLVCTGLFGEDANVTFESTDEKDISSASKFASVTGMNSDSATEHFVNFSNNAYVSSDYRLSYVLNANDLDADEIAALLADGADGRDANGKIVPDNDPTIVEYVKIIRPNTRLSSLDRYWIKAIFDEADKKDDYIEGEVYVGTQSNKDISDDISYSEFVDTYLKDGRAATVTANDNGNWIKAIDNNNDGVAEYIFKVIYTFAQVSRVKDDTVTLDVKNETLDTTDDINELTNEPVVCADELGVGDVVYYAIIDGKAQTYVPEMVTAKIDKVNRNTLTATTTDGAEYVQSDVHEHIQSTAFESGVKNLSGTWTYDLYLDRGGYLAAFTQTTTAENYALLVDGWFMAQRGGDEYAAKVYNRETKELDDTDITSGGSWFIGNSNSDNNRWNSIKALGGSNSTGALNDDDGANNPWIRTTVVALSEDGAAVPVDTVYNEKSRVVRMLATEDNKIPGRTEIKADAYQTSGSDSRAYAYKDTTKGEQVEVRALTSTVYYVVYPLTISNGVVTNYLVKEYVGYGNVPDTVKNGKIDDVYAVGTQQNRLSGIDNDVTDDTNVNYYYTADVVVVEMQEYQGAAEEVFIYDVPEVHNSVTIENVGVIRGDGSNDNVDIDFARSELRYYNPAYGKTIDPGLYYMYETETEGLYTIEPMDHDDIRTSRYATGWSATSYGTVEKDYVEVNAFTYNAAATAPFHTTQTNKTYEYGLTGDSKLYSLSYSDYNRGLDVTDRDYSADLSVYDAEKDDLNDYLGEIVDRTNNDTKNDAYDYENDTDRVYWNHNDLLVKYDSNNKVVYAISFANFEGKYWNLAQNIWNDVKPSVAVTSNPVVKFYDTEATLNGTVYTAAPVKFGQTVDGAVWGIQVTGGTIVMANSTINDDKDAAQTTKNGDGITYTGTILGDDGNYYTYSFAQEPETLKHGQITSADMDKIIVSRPTTDVNGVDQYTFNINPAEVQTTVKSMVEGGVMLAFDGHAILDETDAHPNGYVAYDQYGNVVDINQACLTVKTIRFYLKNATGETYEAVATCTTDVVSWNASGGALCTVTVQTKIGNAGSASNDTAHDVRLFLNWEYPGSPNNNEVQPTGGNNYTYKVPAGASLMLVAESKDWDMTSGTWGVNAGSYNNALNGTWKDGTHWNAVNVNANWTNFTVTFTAPAKPDAPPTASITGSVAGVTLPTTTTSQVGPDGTASFEIEVTNGRLPVLSASNSAVVDLVKGAVGTTTTTWTVNVSGIGASGTTVTVTGLGPETYTINTTGFTGADNAGKVKMTGIAVTLSGGDTLAANDAVLTYSIMRLADATSEWKEVASGEWKNLAVSATGDIFGGGGFSTTDTFTAGSYRVIATLTIESTGQVFDNLTTASFNIA